MIKKITKKIYQQIFLDGSNEIFFQPIVSIMQRKIVGVESLFRTNYKDRPIDIQRLFDYARRNELVGDLDQLCRNNALKTFPLKNQKKMIFINFEANLLKEYINDKEKIMDFVLECGYKPRDITIEINEKGISDRKSVV